MQKTLSLMFHDFYRLSTKKLTFFDLFFVSNLTLFNSLKTLIKLYNKVLKRYATNDKPCVCSKKSIQTIRLDIKKNCKKNSNTCYSVLLF